MRLSEITGKAFEGLEKRVALLPVGSVERHGDHLPLGTDTIIAEAIAEEVASRIGGIVLPPIPYGPCIALRHYPGTFDVGWEGIQLLVRDVLREAHRNGFRTVVIVNGHGGNSNLLRLAARSVAMERDLNVVVVDWWRDVAQKTRDELFSYQGHAGEDETSVLLAVREDLADMEAADRNIRRYPRLSLYSRKKYERVFGKPLVGDATRADQGRGRRFLEAVVEEIVSFLREEDLV